MIAFLLPIEANDDHEILLHIYHSYHKDMLALATSVLGRGRGHDAEDAIQNAYLNLHKYRHRLRSITDDDQLRAYVLTIVKNEARRLLKKSPDTEDIDEYSRVLVSDEDFVRRIEQEQQYQKLVAAISSLDDKYRIPMYLHWVEDLSVKQIARMTGIPLKTVYTNLSRGKGMLIKLLDKEV